RHRSCFPIRRRLPAVTVVADGDHSGEGGRHPVWYRGAVLRKRRLFGYEPRHQPLLSREAFARRLAAAVGSAPTTRGINTLGLKRYLLVDGRGWLLVAVAHGASTPK